MWQYSTASLMFAPLISSAFSSMSMNLHIHPFLNPAVSTHIPFDKSRPSIRIQMSQLVHFSLYCCHTMTAECQIIKLLRFTFHSYSFTKLVKIHFNFLYVDTLEAILGFSIQLKDTSTYRQEELGIMQSTLMINGQPCPPPNAVCVAITACLKEYCTSFRHADMFACHGWRDAL